MTTKNLTNLDEIIAMQRRLDEMVVNTVTERDEALQAEERRLEAERARIQRDHETATNNALIAARLRQQHRDDQFAGVDAESEIVREERDQMAFIREGTPLPAPVAVQPVPVIVPASEAAAVVVPTPAEVVEAPRQRSQYHIRNWSLLAWILAIVGFFIAWNIIGRNWDEAIFDSVASTLIWVGGLGLGFFLGGTIGQALANRLSDNNEAQAIADQPVVVAQPAQVVVVQQTPVRQTPPPPPAQVA